MRPGAIVQRLVVQNARGRWLTTCSQLSAGTVAAAERRVRDRGFGRVLVEHRWRLLDQAGVVVAEGEPEQAASGRWD